MTKQRYRITVSYVIQPFEYPELDDKAKDDLLRERILHEMIISKESE